MIQGFLLVNRQGKCRLQRWYGQPEDLPSSDKTKMIREICHAVTSRHQSLIQIVSWKGFKLVYKKYASLYFICIVDEDDNELIVFEIIHAFVTVLDTYFRNVCELDLLFRFHLAYSILDEFIVSGHVSETSKSVILMTMKNLDKLSKTFDSEAPPFD